VNTVIDIGLGYLAVSGLAVWVWVRLGRTCRPTVQERAAAGRQRVGLTEQNIADQAFVRNVEAELKDYAAILADYYDTTTGDR
jgi:hypothetical protein